jgi:hypothetical protein
MRSDSQSLGSFIVNNWMLTTSAAQGQDVDAEILRENGGEARTKPHSNNKQSGTSSCPSNNFLAAKVCHARCF